MIRIIRIINIMGLLLLTMPVFAVEVEPHRIELNLPAGKTSEASITVTNWLDYPVQINVKTDHYRQILTDNSIPPAKGKGRLPSCEKWLKFEPNEFELSSTASIIVKCIIDVPAGTREEHVASILFDEKGLITTYEKEPGTPGNITLEVTPRFTIPVYITPAGNETVSATISDMKVLEGPTIGTIKTEITVLNNGTVHIRPSGNLVLMNSSGNIEKTIPIGECLPVFPNYKEKIPVYYPEMLRPDIYTAICTINIGEGKLLQRRTRFRVTEDYDIE